MVQCEQISRGTFITDLKYELLSKYLNGLGDHKFGDDQISIASPLRIYFMHFYK
jgi:hypothetical protein